VETRNGGIHDCQGRPDVRSLDRWPEIQVQAIEGLEFIDGHVIQKHLACTLKFQRTLSDSSRGTALTPNIRRRLKQKQCLPREQRECFYRVQTAHVVLELAYEDDLLEP